MISNDNIKDKIYVYDVFTELYDSENEQFRLLPNELYLYCFLYRNRSHDYITKINVESIHQSMPVKFKPSKATKNRVEIKNNLLSLRSKGIIHFNIEAESLYSKSGNYKSLDITFAKFTERKGHLQVSYSDFDSSDHIDYFYIRVAVERFKKVKTKSGYDGRWISENEFGKLLGTTGKTFQNKANQMIARGLLYKASGKKKENSNEQDRNVYNVIPFGFENKKVTTTQVNRPLDEVKAAVEIVADDSSERIEWGNWKNSNNKITYDDCLLYWKQRYNKEFADVCDERLARIPDNARYYIQKDLDLAEEKLNEQKFRDQAAINVKNKKDKIHLIKSCQGIPVASDGNGIIDLPIDEIGNLKLNDEIYLLNETEEWDQGYRAGTRIEIKKYFVKSLINGEADLRDSSEFVEFSEKNMQVLFEKFKKIICERGLFVAEDLKILSKFRDNLILEESAGRDIKDDWEGDVYACYGPSDVINLSKEKRLYSSLRKNKVVNPVAAAQRKIMNDLKNRQMDISGFLEQTSEDSF